MEKAYILRAEPYDGWAGRPLASNYVFTKAQTETIDKQYLEWFKTQEIEDDDDRPVVVRDYKIYDPFMMFLSDMGIIHINDEWETVDWEELELYVAKEA